MERVAIAILAGCLAALGAAGCTEEPQELHVSEQEAAYAAQKNSERQERTLRQSESQRIY